MKKLTAAGAAIVGLALSAAGALAATPAHQGSADHEGVHGAAVSAVARNGGLVGGAQANHGGAVSTAAQGTHGADPSVSSSSTTTTAAAGAHGAAVSLVAKNHLLVGGKHHNHGGAVRVIARGSHAG